MPDWTFQPEYDYPISAAEPEVLKTTLADKKQLRRRKSSVTQRIVREVYTGLTRAQADSMLDFYELKLTDVAFTKYGYDPRDATDQTESSWTFVGPPQLVYVALDVYEATVDFESDHN